MASMCFHGIEKRADGKVQPKFIEVQSGPNYQNVTLDAGSVFYVHKITAFSRELAASFLMVIDHDGRSMFENPLPVEHIAGTAGQPYILPIEWEWQGGKQPVRIRVTEGL